MGVLGRVEREVAAVSGAAVTAQVRVQGVRVLVQAQRYQPPRHHEDDDVDRRVPDVEPGQHAAGDEDRHDAQEDRRGAERVAPRPRARVPGRHYSPAGSRDIRYSSRSSSSRTAATTPLATRSRQVWPSQDSASDWLGNSSLLPACFWPFAPSYRQTHDIAAPSAGALFGTPTCAP